MSCDFNSCIWVICVDNEMFPFCLLNSDLTFLTAFEADPDVLQNSGALLTRESRSDILHVPLHNLNIRIQAEKTSPAVQIHDRVRHASGDIPIFTLQEGIILEQFCFFRRNIL